MTAALPSGQQLADHPQITQIHADYKSQRIIHP
jgi:hypothetical protein